MNRFILILALAVATTVGCGTSRSSWDITTVGSSTASVNSLGGLPFSLAHGVITWGAYTRNVAPSDRIHVYSTCHDGVFANSLVINDELPVTITTN